MSTSWFSNSVFSYWKSWLLITYILQSFLDLVEKETDKTFLFYLKVGDFVKSWKKELLRVLFKQKRKIPVLKTSWRYVSPYFCKG